MTATITQAVPTLYEWMGGMPAILKLTDAFYVKVHQDALLGPVFSQAPSSHHIHVAHFIAEVFGGPTAYTDEDGGSLAGMIRKHLFRHLNESMRKRWIALLLETADELGIPDDPEFRSAFVGYIEWGTRIAIMTSNQEDTAVGEEAPMPAWGWGVPGGPYQGA